MSTPQYSETTSTLTTHTRRRVSSQNTHFASVYQHRTVPRNISYETAWTGSMRGDPIKPTRNLALRKSAHSFFTFCWLPQGRIARLCPYVFQPHISHHFNEVAYQIELYKYVMPRTPRWREFPHCAARWRAICAVSGIPPTHYKPCYQHSMINFKS